MTKPGHHGHTPAPPITTPPVLTGGHDPVEAVAWRTTAQAEAIAPLMARLMAFLVQFSPELPSSFIERVTSGTRAILDEIIDHAASGSEMQLTCEIGGGRRYGHCTIALFHYLNYGHGPGTRGEAKVSLIDHTGVRRAIINAQAETFSADDLPGHARQISLLFTHNSPA